MTIDLRVENRGQDQPRPAAFDLLPAVVVVMTTAILIGGQLLETAVGRLHMVAKLSSQLQVFLAWIGRVRHDQVLIATTAGAPMGKSLHDLAGSGHTEEHGGSYSTKSASKSSTNSGDLPFPVLKAQTKSTLAEPATSCTSRTHFMKLVLSAKRRDLTKVRRRRSR